MTRISRVVAIIRLIFIEDIVIVVVVNITISSRLSGRY